ncbi:hypothetical protein SEA_AMORE2_7 [Gordonia phage Amore2]|nr:hypothetical protein SEA_AMORE2_7 [Gordonia phage Amore2]
MSSNVNDKDNEMRGKFGLVVQPDPKPNGNESAHDLVGRDLETKIWVEEDKVRLEYDIMLESFISLCDMTNLDPVEIMEKRKAFGLEKYGTVLQAGNGRNNLKDAVDEIADALVYLNCALKEGNS